MLRPPFVVAREVCVLSGGAACPITPSGKGSRFGQLVRAHARPLRLHRAADLLPARRAAHEGWQRAMPAPLSLHSFYYAIPLSVLTL